MKNMILSATAAVAILAGSLPAFAQSTTTTTTTWSEDQGPEITQYSTTQHYQSVTDPSLQPTVGMVVPGSVTFYPLPPTIKIPDAQNYSYSIINNHPVVVERTTRKIVHTWN